MDKKVIIAILAAAIIVVAAVGIFMGTGDKDNDDKPTGETVTDALGREVEIPSNLDRGIITLGSNGPLRFASMFDVIDDIIEVDKGDVTDAKNGRAYSYAFAYDRLDVETQTHADNKLESATVEIIGEKNPSLIITSNSVWNNNAENFKILEKKCTIVVLMDQQMQYMCDENGKLSEYMTFNINILGKVLNKEDRAKELISGIEGIIQDIMKNKGDTDTKVYVAGVTINGSNPLNTTFPIYLPFNINGVKNAYDLGSTANKAELRIEDFTKMDIDMIVVDPSSSDQIKGNMNSQLVMQYIHGINNDSDKSNDIPIYITVPIVWDSINYDCALASAYYTSYLVYGNLTHDQVEEKIRNIFNVFYGEENAKYVFDDMEAFFAAKSAGASQKMPFLGEVVILKNDDGSYSFGAA